MENIDFATLFQGIGTMMESGWLLALPESFWYFSVCYLSIWVGRVCSNLWL